MWTWDQGLTPGAVVRTLGPFGPGLCKVCARVEVGRVTEGLRGGLLRRCELGSSSECAGCEAAAETFAKAMSVLVWNGAQQRGGGAPTLARPLVPARLRLQGYVNSRFNRGGDGLTADEAAVFHRYCESAALHACVSASTHPAHV
eukprot:360255-Chlamydomonas_euryale.AAC.10